jgi:hypothetical protein
MPKGYWVSAYRTISDPEKLAAYNKLAGPAVEAGGGRILARGSRVVAHDAGIAVAGSSAPSWRSQARPWATSTTEEPQIETPRKGS